MHALYVALALAAAPEPAADVAVVCPSELRSALEPWVRHRRAQGRTLAFVSSDADAQEIRAQIRKVAKGGNLQYVVLVGDADPAMARSSAVRLRSVPTHLVKAVVNVRWGSEPEIASDNWYADLDDDRVPDVAIGRITADTPAELSAIVAKTLAYERTIGHGPWRRRINFVAGLGGFGKLADAALEMTARRLITDGIPADCTTTMTYASWQSPYCPDPRAFHSAAVERLNDGCLFWVYIGHGQPRSLDRLRTPLASHHIFADADVAKLRCSGCPPIACFLACYTAAFDQPEDCLAESMLRSADGPVAVIGGSRVTMPYAMAVLGTELLDECFERKCETLGGAILAAKRSMSREAGSPRRRGLDALASLISPPPVDLAAERAEHQDLFQLIGDPLLQLAHPRAAKITAPSRATAGEAIDVAVEAPFAGRYVVELVARRDRLRFSPSERKYDPSPDAPDLWTDEYRRANDPRWVHAEGNAQGGPLTVSLRVPAAARGACHVRCFIEGQDACASGAADVEIVPAAAR